MALLPPRHTLQRHSKPTGYTVTPPSSFYKSYKSYKSHASVTPTQHAYRRCHQVAQHPPTVTLRQSQTTQRHSNPSGYHMAPPFVRLVRQVRHKRHAPAARKPPLPSNRYKKSGLACAKPQFSKERSVCRLLSQQRPACRLQNFFRAGRKFLSANFT